MPSQFIHLPFSEHVYKKRRKRMCIVLTLSMAQESDLVMKSTPQLDKKQVDKLRSLCICGTCPSFKGTGETALLFCYVGKSSKIKNQRGCICGGCPVKKQQGLRKVYFCLFGTEAGQLGAK
jgi:hypothetical protein